MVGKRGELVGLDLPLEGGGTKAGFHSPHGCPWRVRKLTVWGTEEKHLRLRVKQLVCESLNGMRITEKSLPQPYIPQRRTQVP